MANRYDLTEAAVEVYEIQKVPASLGPLAAATLAQVAVHSDDRVLDLACGTGVLARQIRASHPMVPITGIDLNAAMIAKARALAAALGGPFDWHVAEAAALPVPDGAFTLAFCQQGVQYFSDRAAALVEIARVLAPGGRLAMTFWAPPNAFFRAKEAALTRNVGAAAGQKAVAPFLYPGDEELPGLLEGAGFQNIELGQASFVREIPDVRNGIREDLEGSPLGPMVEAAGAGAMVAVVDDILVACQDLIRDDVLTVPQHAHLIMAVRP
ncbi:MAG: class I SAM-dependent methyltransferase [Pseudomonadota bacterium]